jgi:hypothetical protein
LAQVVQLLNPGQTVKTLQCHPPRSAATAKGHLDQVQQGLCSTHVAPKDLPPPDFDAIFPTQETPTSITAIALPTAPTSKYYTDQSRQFPCTSSSGNNYLLLVYHYDTNCILAEPIPNRKANSIVAGHKQIVKRLRLAGVECSFVMLDNECSHALEELFHSKAIKHQKMAAFFCRWTLHYSRIIPFVLVG